MLLIYIFRCIYICLFNHLLPYSLAETSPAPHSTPEAGGYTQAAIVLDESCVVQLAMQSVSAFAMAKQDKMHVNKVNEFIREREAAHPDAPRILYGLSHPGPLAKDYEIGMNAAALTLLKDNPKLMLWGNGQWRKQALTEAARAALYASGFKLVKGYSKAGGLAGAISPRGSTSKAALDSPGKSKLASSEGWTSIAAFNSPPSVVEVKARVSSALRNSEIDLLPTQITDMQKQLDTMRTLRDDYSKRQQQADLIKAIKMGVSIETMLREVPLLEERTLRPHP